MKDCQNCLSPGCECFECKLRPISVPQTLARITTLEKQLAAQKAIVAADDKFFAVLDWGTGSDNPHHTEVTEFRRNRKNAILAYREARKAAEQLDKEDNDAT